MTPTLSDNWIPIFQPIVEETQRNDDHIVDNNKKVDTPAKLVKVAKFYFKENK